MRRALLLLLFIAVSAVAAGTTTRYPSGIYYNGSGLYSRTLDSVELHDSLFLSVSDTTAEMVKMRATQSSGSYSRWAQGDMGSPMPKLSQKAFESLSPSDKVIYAIIDPELFFQSCADDMHDPKKIYGEWDGFGSLQSGRQTQSLITYHSILIQLLLSYADTSGGFSEAYLRIIAKHNVWEVIPFILKFYRITHDANCLVTLLQLMKHGNYKPFMQSTLHKRLYVDVQSPYRDGIYLTSKVKAEITSQAQAFYKYQLKQ